MADSDGLDDMGKKARRICKQSIAVRPATVNNGSPTAARSSFP
jgi:hypothetical protein